MDQNSILEGVNDPGIFKAVFMAGGPGSGKSFVAKKMGLNALGLKSINSDTSFVNALKKAGLPLKLDQVPVDDINRLRASAKKVTGKQKDLAVMGRLGLIIDSTARDLALIKKMKKNLEEIGYETAVVFVDTSLETALDRNAKRERNVPEKIVRGHHKVIRSNLSKIKSTFGKANYYGISNDGTLADLDKEINKAFGRISTWVKRAPKSPKAKEWIKQMQELNRRESVDEMAQKHSIWSYVDATGVKRNGVLQSTSSQQGSDITYFFVRSDGTNQLDVISGSRLKKVKRLNKTIRTKFKSGKLMIDENISEIVRDITDRSKGSGMEDQVDPAEYHKIHQVQKFAEREMARIFKRPEWNWWARPSNIMRNNSMFSISVAWMEGKETNVSRLNSKRKVDLAASLTDGAGRFVPMKKISFVTGGHSNIGKTVKFRKTSDKTLMGAVKKVMKWMEKWAKATEKEIEEKGGINNIRWGESIDENVSIGGGAIPTGPESVGIEPDGKFGKTPVFNCDQETFGNCVKGKKKFERWSAFLGKDNDFFVKMQTWMAQSYKNKDFVMRSPSGEMVFARKRKNSTNEGILKQDAHKNKHSISPGEIQTLRREFSKISKIDPASPTYKKMEKYLNSLNKRALEDLGNAKIKFISILAKNRLRKK